MASSSSNQVPQIPDLFSWNPPRLSLRERPVRAGVKLATSRKTREPAFFDRHFSEKLKLFHVKRLPTLISDLTSVVDKSLAKFVQLPVSHFHSADSILDTVSEIEKNVVDEKEVASFYERTTASFSIRVASVLALGVRRLLRWSQSANVSGCAIADGFLYFPDPTDTDSALLYAQLEAKLGKETVDLIRLLGKDRSSLTTHEFKNLAAGCGEVMLVLPKLSNLPKFPWTDCTAPDCATLSKHEVQRGKVEGTGRIIGHDAKSPPWTLNHLPIDSVFHRRGSSETRKRKRDDDCNNQNIANPSPPLEPSYDQDKLPVHRRSSRPFMPPPHMGVGVETAFPTVKGKDKDVAKGTGEVQSNDNENGDNEDDDVCDLSYTDENDLSAIYIVQQAWAQAARTNCSMLDIALKLALGSERGNALRNEYRIYRLLGKRGVTAGITTPLGLFDDVQGDACALVMPYMGSPLADMPEFVLTSSYQEAILATVKEIHRADILHGDLRLDNVLVADSGHTIIDFSLSGVCCDQDAKDREYSRFEDLLVQRARRNRKSL